MRKNYWKECCLLLIGLILGCLYQKHFESLPIKEETTIVKHDTIIKKDTIYAKAIIPSLSRTRILMELKKQNIPCANIVLAQSVLESANYTSKLTKTHNNIFGLRKNGKYRKYDNYIACISDYKKYISSKYKGGDYYLFLKKLGYAEDPNYVEKLKEII